MMHIRVEPYCPDMDAAWDDFIRQSSRNGGIFQERTFLGYHPSHRYCDDSLLFRAGNEIVGILPVARLETSEHGKVAFSHPGSTAGGLIYHRQMTLRDVLAMLELAIEYYRSRNYDRIELRLAEALFSYPSDGELIYLVWHRGFKLVTREISSCVDLRDSANWFGMGRKKNPGTIRALQKQGVQCFLAQDLKPSYDLIACNLQMRFGKHPTHSFEELADLKQRYPERIHPWLAVHRGVPVATIVVFVVNRHAVHDFYIAQNYDYAKLNVMPALFYGAFEHYQAEGYDWFNFGLSSRGDWIKWGILEFKERMGGRAITKDVWALDNLMEYRPCRPPEGGGETS